MKDLFEISLKAIRNFIVHRIENETNRNQYVRIIDHIIYSRLFSTDCKQGYNKLIEILVYDKHLNNMSKYKFHFVANPKKYADLAYEHALDVANSLNKRFITGGESAYYVRKIDKCLR
jgi:hypothetical protein